MHQLLRKPRDRQTDRRTDAQTDRSNFDHFTSSKWSLAALNGRLYDGAANLYEIRAKPIPLSWLGYLKTPQKHENFSYRSIIAQKEPWENCNTNRNGENDH